MALETISTPPTLADFTLLSEHEQQTPGTFFGGKPVLHLHAPAATLQVPPDQFAAQRNHLESLTGDNNYTSDDERVSIAGVHVWVTSKNLIFFSPIRSSGLRIAYPTITVTAQDGSDVLLELNLSDADTADEDIEFLQLRVTPTTIDRHAGDEAPAEASGGSNGTTSHNDASTALFKAISDCQELNPDPPALGEEGEGEGEDGAGFDETAPGATGWITSENMADFMDEDGNFRMPAGVTVVGGEDEPEEEEVQDEREQRPEPLGEGAGRTRTAAEALEDEESKWQRTG